MNTTDPKKNSSTIGARNCSNKIPVNGSEKFSEGMPVTPYVLEREPHVFDSYLVEMLHTISSHEFMTCKPDALEYVFELLTSVMQRVNTFYESKHSSRPEPENWNMTQSEIDDLPKPFVKE